MRGRCRLGSTSPILISVPEIPASSRAAGTPTGGLFVPPVHPPAVFSLRPVAPPGIPPVGALAALGREFLLTPARPVGLPLFFLPGPGFHVPGSRFRCFFFPVPGSMFHVPGSAVFFPAYWLLATAYWLLPTGLPRCGYVEIYFCTITTVLTMIYCWGGGTGIRQIFPIIFLQIMPPVVEC